MSMTWNQSFVHCDFSPRIVQTRQALYPLIPHIPKFNQFVFLGSGSCSFRMDSLCMRTQAWKTSQIINWYLCLQMVCWLYKCMKLIIISFTLSYTHRWWCHQGLCWKNKVYGRFDDVQVLNVKDRNMQLHYIFHLQCSVLINPWNATISVGGTRNKQNWNYKTVQ